METLYEIPSRLQGRGRRRRADIAFTGAKVAVFSTYALAPVSATWFIAQSEQKLRLAVRRNNARDGATNVELGDAGWLVIRIWEHEDVNTAADRVEAAVRVRGSRRGDSVDVMRRREGMFNNRSVLRFARSRNPAAARHDSGVALSRSTMSLRWV